MLRETVRVGVCVDHSPRPSQLTRHRTAAGCAPTSDTYARWEAAAGIFAVHGVCLTDTRVGSVQPSGNKAGWSLATALTCCISFRSLACMYFSRSRAYCSLCTVARTSSRPAASSRSASTSPRGACPSRRSPTSRTCSETSPLRSCIGDRLGSHAARGGTGVRRGVGGETTRPSGWRPHRPPEGCLLESVPLRLPPVILQTASTSPSLTSTLGPPSESARPCWISRSPGASSWRMFIKSCYTDRHATGNAESGEYVVQFRVDVVWARDRRVFLITIGNEIVPAMCLPAPWTSPH